MTRPIAVGVDGSPQSRAAADWAAREARARGLPLLLVHAWIVEPLDSSPTFQDRERAASVLHEVASVLSARYPGLAIHSELLADVPSAALPEQTGRAELLALGSRGHSALVGFLLGSVGLHVLAHAQGPVVLVRDRPHGRTEQGDEVVVGLKELGVPAQSLLRFAFATAAAHGAAVRAVRAWGAPGLFGHDLPRSLRPDEPLVREETAEAREAAALAAAVGPWRERHPGIPVIEHLRFGNASEVLLSAADLGACLVVLGRRLRRPTLSTRIGPVVHAAVHHARAPVAIVPYT